MKFFKKSSKDSFRCCYRDFSRNILKHTFRKPSMQFFFKCHQQLKKKPTGIPEICLAVSLRIPPEVFSQKIFRNFFAIFGIFLKKISEVNLVVFFSLGFPKKFAQTFVQKFRQRLYQKFFQRYSKTLHGFCFQPSFREFFSEYLPRFHSKIPPANSSGYAKFRISLEIPSECLP